MVGGVVAAGPLKPHLDLSTDFRELKTVAEQLLKEYFDVVVGAIEVVAGVAEMFLDLLEIVALDVNYGDAWEPPMMWWRN